MSERLRNKGADAPVEQLKMVPGKSERFSPEESKTKIENLSKSFASRLDSLPNLGEKDKQRLKSEFVAFVLDSAANRLPAPLSRYSEAAADTDGETGLDPYEFRKYAKGLEEAFGLMAEAGGIDQLKAMLTKFESDAKGSFSVKNFNLFSKRAPNSPDAPANFFAEKYGKLTQGLPPEETRRLLSARLGDNPDDFQKGLRIAIGTKAPAEVFEIVGRLAYDSIKAVPQFVEYASLALRSSFADTGLARKELSVRMRTILDDNAIVGLLALGSDSLTAGANALMGTELSADGETNRARELLHRMGNFANWTPESIKDALPVLVPAILKLRQMRNARTGEAQAPKNPEAGPDARLDLSNYDTEAKISGLRKRLGLPEAATAAEIEKAYLEKRSATLDRYSELGKENLGRIGKDFAERLRAGGVQNPERVIADELKSVNEAYAKGELLVAHLHDDVPGIREKGFLSAHEISDVPFSKRPKYGADRTSTEFQLGAVGLDPKYVAVLAYREELVKMSQKYDTPVATRLSLDDFQGIAGVTMYDSMLLGKTQDGPSPFMFTLDDVLTVRALKNIENRYNRQHDVGYGAKLEREATSGQTGKMEELYTGVPGFVEIQVFGKIPYPEGKTAPVKELSKTLPNAPKQDGMKSAK